MQWAALARIKCAAGIGTHWLTRLYGRVMRQVLFLMVDLTACARFGSSAQTQDSDNKCIAVAKFFAMLNLLTITCGFATTPALATTPVRFRLVQNQIVTSVLVNGTGPFDFVFDTGASSTVIDSELAKQLSLSVLESESLHTVTGSKTVSRYQIDSLGLGPKSVRSLTVLCAESLDIHAISPKVRGVLGQNFLSRFDFILNYRDQRIEFEEGGEYAGKLQGARLPVERDRGRILITTQLSSPRKRASKLVMDSGVSSVVVFTATTKNADLEIESDVNGGVNASTILGNQTISTGRLRKLQIGTEKFSWLPVRVVDNRAVVLARPEDGLLPTSLFRSIYFNNTQNYVILNPRLPIRILTSNLRSYRDDLLSKSSILAAKKAYALSGNGTQIKEFGFALVRNDDGSVSTTNVTGFEAAEVRITAPRGTIAVFHTHRNNVNPRPSSRDVQEADDKQLIFGVISTDGLWVYEPDTAKKGKGTLYKLGVW